MGLGIFSSNWNKLSAADRKNELHQYLLGLDPIILCLDDDKNSLDTLKVKLESMGFSVFATTQSKDALNFIQRNRSALTLIISDQNTPGSDLFEFRKQVQIIAEEIPFILMAANFNTETKARGAELKINAFISKPINDDVFQTLIIKETSSRLKVIYEERELLKGFTDDATNLIEQVEEIILELEDNPTDTETVSKIFGMIHTIKGSSGFFEPRTLHTFAHRFEDTLKDVQSGALALTPAVISVWLKGTDVLKTLIDEFKSGQHNKYDLNEITSIFDFATAGINESHLVGAKETSELPIQEQNSPPQQKQKGPQELKVSVVLLDEFMQISGEMTVIRNMINKIVRSIEKQYPTDKDVTLLGELLGELHKINSSVQSKITEIRKVPVKSIVKPLGRIIRDTSQALRKEVDLKIEGEEIRIDNSVAEVLSNSLIHLVRNSLDHGVETPEERSKSGKKLRGEVKISTRIDGETILVDILDDGKGINPEAIRRKLLSNGTHTLEQVNALSQPELFQMIFSAGFSTAQKITDISGRGVGMSMVKDVVETIGGRIIIESHLNKGTKFTLSIPIPKSVLITNCLFVTSKNMQFGVPQDQILRIIKFEEAKQRNFIDQMEGTNILRIDQELMPILSLRRILAGEFRNSEIEEDNGYLVILSTNNRNFCLCVDSVLDVEDTVVKAINAGQIKNLGLYMGATFLGDGTIGLILNIEGIAKKTGILNVHSGHTKFQKSAVPTADQLAVQYNLDVLICELQNHSRYAIPQESIYRLEEFNTNALQQSGSFIVAPYRDHMITFVDLQNFIENPKLFSPKFERNQTLKTIVITHKSGFIGLVVSQVLDLVTAHNRPEEGTVKMPGSAGWLILGDRSVVLMNIPELIDWITGKSGAASSPEVNAA